MIANRLVFAFLLLSSSTVLQVAADQTEADRRSLAELRAKAQEGNSRSQFELGTVFQFGSLGVAKDYVEAVKWYRKAAEQNHVWAQYNLGLCYHQGKGVAKDDAEAVKWFRKAAEQNDADSEYDLGVAYYNGEGVAKDYVEAVKWYRKAAEQNHVLAQYYLGLCFAMGDGAAKDYVQAYMWLLLAAGQGHENAKQNMALLEQKMTADQISQGQKAGAQFQVARSALPSKQ